MSETSLYNNIYVHGDNDGFYHWCCGRVRHFFTVKTRMRLKIELDDFTLSHSQSKQQVHEVAFDSQGFDGLHTPTNREQPRMNH